MPHRIVYCALRCASLLAPLPHDRLRNVDGGVVVGVTDHVAVELMKVTAVPVLYCSRSAYGQAVKGLSEPEIDDSLRRRLKQWSPRALDFATEWIVRDQRRSLALTALALETARGNTASLLMTHFDRGLDLVVSLLRPGGYDDVEFPDLITAVVEKDVMLMAEVGGTSERQSREHFAKGLAEELKRLGEPEFAQALPHAQPVRGVWVAPVDPGLRQYLNARGITGIDWRGGVVASLPVLAIREFQSRGKKTRILYYEGGALMQDIDDRGSAQMSRRFEELAAASDAERASEKADYVNRLRLDVALVRRALRARADEGSAGITLLLDQQIRTETQILASQLAHDRSSGSGEVHGTPLIRLRSADEDLIEDAAFFEKVARQGNHAELAERMYEVGNRKQKDAGKLADIEK
jgi:hypothetical protein